jgi:hypothetical protein
MNIDKTDMYFEIVYHDMLVSVGDPPTGKIYHAVF